MTRARQELGAFVHSLVELICFYSVHVFSRMFPHELKIMLQVVISQLNVVGIAMTFLWVHLSVLSDGRVGLLPCLVSQSLWLEPFWSY